MNKFAKGSLAAGAGLVLLLGGAGTLAYWNDSADLAGGAISAGTLSLAADNDQLGTSIDAQPDMWVPGDQHTFSTTLTLTAEGDNIQGEIALDTDALELAGEGFDQFTVDMSMGEVTTAGSKDAIEFHETLDGKQDVITFDGPGAYEIPVSVTVTFPYDDEAVQNTSMGATVDFENLTFTATQTAADGAVTK